MSDVTLVHGQRYGELEPGAWIRVRSRLLEVMELVRPTPGNYQPTHCNARWINHPHCGPRLPGEQVNEADRGADGEPIVVLSASDLQAGWTLVRPAPTLEDLPSIEPTRQLPADLA